MALSLIAFPAARYTGCKRTEKLKSFNKASNNQMKWSELVSCLHFEHEHEYIGQDLSVHEQQ